MKSLIDLAVPLITFVVLLTVGLDLTLAEFRRVRGQPRVVAAGLLGPLLTLPLLAWGLILVFSPPPAVQTGLLLIAACPIGGISNVYSHLAGASPALSVVLTGASGLLAVVSIPLLDRAFGLVLGQSLGLNAPVTLLVAQLLAMLALPIGVGMWLRHRCPVWVTRLHGRLRRLGFAGLAALVTLIVSSDAAALTRDLHATVPLAATFVAMSFGVGWLMAAGVESNRADRFTVASEFATRNVAVATVVAVSLAGRLEFALFATTYLLTEIPLMLGAIWTFRRLGGGRRIATRTEVSDNQPT